MKKAAVFSPYWDTLGGGEKYVATAAQVFVKSGFKTKILWHDVKLPSELKERFGIDIQGIEIDPNGYNVVTRGNIFDKFNYLRNLDLFFFLSDGSVPLPLAKRTLVHFQVPFKKAGWFSKFKLSVSREVLCNSEFTKKIIDETFDVHSSVLYPPATLLHSSKKEKIILSVGRFASKPTSKRQDLLLKAFVKLDLPDWKLVLAGGSKFGTESIEKLKRESENLPIEVIGDPSYDELSKLYSAATIYWHAAGFGTNLSKHPEYAEHFGISTVEAMSAGAVPVVFAGGGQIEIVRDGKDGFLWSTMEELIKRTKVLAENNKLLSTFRDNAEKRSGEFSREKFEHGLKTIIG